MKKLKALILVALTLLIYVSCAITYVLCLKSNIKQMTYNYLSELAKQNAEVVKTQIKGDFRLLKNISLFISRHEEFNINHTINFLRDEMKSNNFKRMGIIALDGTAVLTEGIVEKFSDKEYFKKARQGETVISNSFKDVIDGEYINVYATPIYKDKEIVSVLFATHRTELYKELLEVSTFGGAGYSYIIESSGRQVVSSSNPNSLNKFYNLFEVLRLTDAVDAQTVEIAGKNMKEGIGGRLEYELNGVNKYANYEPIGINDWYIISIVPENAVSPITIDIIQLTLLVTAIATGVFCILFTYILINYKKSKKLLEDIAYKDGLTGGANWYKFKIDSEQILKENINEDYVIISFDIDKFKVINDLFGYTEGNKLLQYISDLGGMFIDEKEAFARVSADNFNMLLRYGDEDELITRIEKFSRIINNFSSLYNITLTFGIYKIKKKQLELQVLSDRAIVAKRSIKNRQDIYYAFYSDEMRTQMIEEKEIENTMKSALEQGEFKVYLQPKYSLNIDAIIGAEALVRWVSRKGVTLPDKFIPIFEKNGFIKRLDFYMFESVCELMHKWQSNGIAIREIPISVNLSRLHLNTPYLAYELEDIANKYYIRPEYLEIELTESAIFDNVDSLINVMKEIKNVGFKISMDDFGSGYSSLNLLKDLPVDVLKIDRGFLCQASECGRGKLILSSIMHMGSQLGLKTIAEGVETKEQADLLRDMGCDMAQGYYYDRPMTIKEFEDKFFIDYDLAKSI